MSLCGGAVLLSENVQFLEVKFSIYLNRRVFVICPLICSKVYNDSESGHGRP